MSVLTKKQVRVYGPKPIKGWGKGALIKAKVRFDDQCGNGHNSFSITGEIYKPGAKDIMAGGCLHEEIAKHFPELKPYLKWHLASTDGPMHYIANTIYWAEEDNLQNARSSAIWPEATDEDLLETGEIWDRSILRERLADRLPGLLEEFRSAIESLGLTW